MHPRVPELLLLLSFHYVGKMQANVVTDSLLQSSSVDLADAEPAGPAVANTTD